MPNGKIQVESHSGNVKCETVNNIEIQAKSGGVHITKLNEVYVDASAKSGSVKVNENSRKSDIELKIRTTSGSIRVNKT